MIDLTILRHDPEGTVARIHKKDPTFDGAQLVALDKQVRALQMQVETVRHKKNELAQQGKGGVTQALRDASIALAKELKETEQDLHAVQAQFQQLYLACPNLPSDDLPVGFKEANAVVTEWGTVPHFAFTPKNHLELGTALGWFDFAAAARMTGSQFALYKGQGARLVYALTRLMIEHNQKHGYSLVIPPYLVNEASLIASSNFPKFRDQVYQVSEDTLFLTPTAEVNLLNMYRDHIFESAELPVRMTAWTSCFRREAGGYGATERGLIRIHQFEKVELFTFCEPTQADAELERMVTCAQELLQMLELSYRISLLATQDCSFPSARTYDIEVWMPGQNAFYEVSSCSNCTDFQARRAAVRYRASAGSKPTLAYTLNGSSLALPRLMVALLENYQQPDGSVRIPDILKQYGA
ncbi:MAG: serine--tRNA ligase [Candidatus Babeliales bacterium]